MALSDELNFIYSLTPLILFLIFVPHFTPPSLVKSIKGQDKKRRETPPPIYGYADDHQIYKSFPVNSEYQVLFEELPLCFIDIKTWMA